MRARRGWGLATSSIALLLSIAGLASPPAGEAHAIVLESTPERDAQLAEAPHEVVLRFNSKIEHTLSRVSIQTAGARPVPLAVAAGAAAPDRLVIPLSRLAPGTYVVRYRVLAADGHLTEGSLRFTIRASH